MNERIPQMNEAKTQLGQKIQALKDRKGLSWQDIADAAGFSPVWTCAACLGQMSVPAEAAMKIAELLGLSEAETAVLSAIPYRGSLPTAAPSDPLIYRFHELVSVYGTTWKALIHEEFGDGIMSAIDFDMTLERQPDPKGDRVRIVMSGKFLPYKTY
jgi:cyanate lyase